MMKAEGPSPFGQSLNSQTQLGDARTMYSQRPQQTPQQQNPYGMQQQAQMQNPFMGGMGYGMTGGYSPYQMQNPFMGGMGMQQGGYGGQMQNPYMGGMGYGQQGMGYGQQGMGYGMQQMQNPYMGGMGYGMPQMQNPYMGGMGYGMPQMQNPYMGGMGYGMPQMQNPYGPRGGFDRRVGGGGFNDGFQPDDTYKGYQQQMSDLRNKMMQHRQSMGPQTLQPSGPTYSTKQGNGLYGSMLDQVRPNRIETVMSAEQPYDYEQRNGPSGKPITGPQYGPDRRNEYRGMSQIGRMMDQVNMGGMGYGQQGMSAQSIGNMFEY
jgi:hypothetical protein